MVARDKDLAQLQQIARLKADRQLKKFAAFRQHYDRAQQRIDGLQEDLAQTYASEAPFTIAEARLANLQAARSARDLAHAVGELRRMQPKFDAARLAASREFGRAEVLKSLKELALAERKARGGQDQGTP